MNPLLLFPDFSIIALGYVLRRFWLPAQAWVTIEKLVYYVLFPCLLFFSVASSAIQPTSAGLFAAGGLVVIACTFSLGLVAKTFSKMGPVDFASGLQIAYRFNSYIGLALVSRLGGQSAVANMAILFAFGVPLCNMLAVSTMSKGSKRDALVQIAQNPLIIGTVSGLVVKLLGIGIPEPVMLTLDRLAQGSVTLGLLAVGSGLVFSGLKGQWAASLWWLTLKLIVSPALALSYAVLMHLPHTQALVLVVFASLPSASSAYILAARMGGNAPLVACLISLTTVCAAGTIPLVLRFALPYLG